MSSTGPVRTGIVFSASHPRVGLYWNFLRFYMQLDDGAQEPVDWKQDSFIAVTAGKHKISVVGKPITGVGPKRAKATITVDVPFNRIVRVHYQGPPVALAFVGQLPLLKAKLTAQRPVTASPFKPPVESSVEEFDTKPPS